MKASRRYLFWKIGERTSPSSCGFDHPPAPRAREGQRNLDLNFSVVICLRPHYRLSTGDNETLPLFLFEPALPLATISIAPIVTSAAVMV
ncbi:MAG: hypothetical protein DME45_10160 [Verrucomicrobia bacterium]|nr:MAG: hypothetical protein DME45_10160 [Verrucomicrobiota bacterium]